jgi:G3E family GTPase
MNKIPFYIISGFLGSGKTTFLKKIIEDYSREYKLGIIQNEFAPSNIDGEQLKKTGEHFNLLEINNGSVFCVCLLGDFVRSLGVFIEEYQPDILIIEASGLSDTTSVSEVLSTGPLGEKVFLASNWCIVDAQNFAKTGMMKHRVNQQIRMADVVIINKVDLAGKQSKKVADEITELNPFAEIKETVYCNTDFDVGKTSVRKFYMGEITPLSRPNVNSMVLKTGRRISRESLDSFLNKWAPRSYRIKGYVNTTENKTLAVQCTFDNIELSEVKNIPALTELIALSDQFTLREFHRSYKQMS